jgi:hypothetical protein
VLRRNNGLLWILTSVMIILPIPVIDPPALLAGFLGIVAGSFSSYGLQLEQHRRARRLGEEIIRRVRLAQQKEREP